MPDFVVTIRQHVLEEKTVIVEAANEEEAWDAVDAEYDGDGFVFVEIPDRWVDSVKEVEAEDEKA